MSVCKGRSVAVLIPVFNDWESLEILLPELDSALAAESVSGTVLAIDDGSTIPPGAGLRALTYRCLRPVKIVHLRCNVGHQRAIAVGLAAVSQAASGLDAIVIMDGDGEDNPAHIPRLLSALLAAPVSQAV